MQVGAYLVADAESFELVEPGERPLYHPAGLAQARAVRGTASGDLGGDSSRSDEAPVLVEVVAAVGEQAPGAMTWSAAQAMDVGNRVQEWHELGDVVTVSAGQRDGERGSLPVDDDVVLAAGPGAIDRRRSGVSPL